jgi:peptidoglycan-N-acetylglucosamine deacetylase
MAKKQNIIKTKILFFFSGVLFVVLLTLIGYGLFQVSKSRTFQFFGELIARVDTDKKVVAITFDDAPTDFTEDVLQTLKEKKVNGTFYVVGSALEKSPEIGRKIVLNGHELGNHSYSHERFLLKSQTFIHDEIQRTNSLIKETGYKGEITFRPPNGKKLFGLPWYLASHNIKTIMWDVEPDTYLDTHLSTTDQVTFLVTHTVDRVKPGSIILLHPFCQNCESQRLAIPLIIDELRKKGYTFVTIADLIALKMK